MTESTSEAACVAAVEVIAFSRVRVRLALSVAALCTGNSGVCRSLSPLLGIHEQSGNVVVGS